jgi:hypothetical protein
VHEHLPKNGAGELQSELARAHAAAKLAKH